MLLKRTAYVYRGAATCPDSCADAYIELVESAGFTVVNKDLPIKDCITEEDLIGVSLYVQPGGNADIDIDFAVVKNQVEVIQNFVKAGGRYIGSCTGCWLSTKGYYELLPYEAGYYVALHNKNRGKHGGIKVNDTDNHILQIDWTKLDRITETRSILYAGGPFIAGAGATNPEEVVAWFMERVPAAVVRPYGNGIVAVCGAHPEASQEWYDDSPKKDQEEWDGRLALDLALDMIERLGPWEN